MNIYTKNKNNYIYLIKNQIGGIKTEFKPSDIVPENLEKFTEAFKEPFGFINNGFENEYDIDNISMTMFDENLQSEKIDLKNISFPNDIHTVYIYKKGIHDRKPWYFIGMLKNATGEYYVYYEAECDYTGFDCQGSMKLYISKYFSRIIKLAIPDKIRSELFRKTAINPFSISN